MFIKSGIYDNRVVNCTEQLYRTVEQFFKYVKKLIRYIRVYKLFYRIKISEGITIANQASHGFNIFNSVKYSVYESRSSKNAFTSSNVYITNVLTYTSYFKVYTVRPHVNWYDETLAYF